MDTEFLPAVYRDTSSVAMFYCSFSQYTITTSPTFLALAIPPLTTTNTTKLSPSPQSSSPSLHSHYPPGLSHAAVTTNITTTIAAAATVIRPSTLSNYQRAYVEATAA
ncbi:hypothetical protein E2C01_048871 [Portunus trituberculatus]|uniref:Uncharacterized protein n=1 Tax=Portunus trituberculatus TaxID=210409 RepID=A0A5B7G7J7_PORTR|nr:hypothetical protein [Portunus trituberculatus]